jgi:protein involved in polysaccharide export with SLBB domain
MRPVAQCLRSCVFVASGLLGMQVLAVPSRAQSIVGTPSQANERIKELSAEAAKNGPHDYVIGNGDLVDIEVFDVKELSREVRVSQTGTIGIPLVPVRLHITGLTEIQAEQKISEVLEADGLVSHAEVSVTVKDRKSKPITVVGAVGHALVYQADRQVTLLEVLAEAGGVSNDAGDRVIITRPARAQFIDVTEAPPIGPEDPAANISSATGASSGSSAAEPPPLSASSTTPPVSSHDAPPVSATPSPSTAAASQNGNTITINLNDLVESGDATNNIPLLAGDIVTVPHAGIVYVIGAVTRPGGFVLSNDRSELSTLKILALAGGMTPTAKSDHVVIIRKSDQGQQHEIQIDLKKILKRQAEDVQLQPSDVLYVPDSKVKAAMIKAAELGVALGTSLALYRIAY